MLSLLVAKACGGVNEDSINYAATSEILHNATLLHDDVADESSERRGVPTVYAAMGASCAVLVGDYWLSKSMNLVLRSKTKRDEVISLFSKTLSDLAEGEMIQLEKASSGDTVEEDYFKIIYNKTASLFVAACRSAALSTGACKEFVEAATEYARNAGIAFQIKDDILDYDGTDNLGKPVGIDLKEQKITLPLLCALKDSDREAEVRSLVREIRNCPDNCDTVRSFVIERSGIQKAAKILDSYIEKAERALDLLPSGQARDWLVRLVRFNSYRKA